MLARFWSPRVHRDAAQRVMIDCQAGEYWPYFVQRGLIALAALNSGVSQALCHDAYVR